MALVRLIAFTLLISIGGCTPKLPSFDQHDPIALPKNLDAYLASSEAKVKDLKPGTEKEIRWFQKNKKQTKFSIVYFHGFSASKREIHPVVEKVADAIGANVYFARLTGHGVNNVSAIANAKPTDWIQDSWEAMEIAKRLGENVILMGYSMGAVPAVQLALRNREVSHVILFAPALGWSALSMNLALSPIGKFVLHRKFGATRSFKAINKEHEYFWTTTYEVEALQNLFTFTKVQSETDLSLLMPQTLIFYSKDDPIIPYEYIENRFREIGAGIKHLIHVDDANKHLITGEIGAPKAVPFTEREILRFLK